MILFALVKQSGKSFQELKTFIVYHSVLFQNVLLFCCIKETIIIVIKKTRFFGHVETDATRFFSATDDIEKEILKHLNSIKGVNVKISVHIEAENKEGF